MPKVKISISFILYVALLILLGRGFFLLTYLLVLFIHEYSHAYVAYKLGYKLNSITLAPFGICLNIDNNSIDRFDSIKIAVAGPLINFILAILCMAIWWAHPASYCFLSAFFEANVVTGTFNLLPCFPLDGGRVLNSCINPKNPKLVFGLINIFFTALFLFMFVYFNFNISFLMIAIFFVLSINTFSKNIKYDYMLYVDKKCNNITKVKSYIVPASLQLFKLVPKLSQNVFSIFLVVDQDRVVGEIYESQLKNIFSSVPPTTLIKNIVLNGKRL